MASGGGMKEAPHGGCLREVAPVGAVVVNRTKAIPVARRRRVPPTRRRPLLFRYHVQPGGEIFRKIHAGVARSTSGHTARGRGLHGISHITEQGLGTGINNFASVGPTTRMALA